VFWLDDDLPVVGAFAQITPNGGKTFALRPLTATVATNGGGTYCC
jgi:hypothetical protein